MNINIAKFALSALAASALPVSMTAYSESGPVEIQSIVHPNVTPIEIEIEASYEAPLGIPYSKEDIYLNPEQIVNPNEGVNGRLAAAEMSDQSGTSYVTMASSPPVYAINLGSSYNDTLTTSIPEKWYVFSVGTATKFTTLLQHLASGNSNIDIELYRQPTGATSYSYVAGSYMGGANNEQLSEISVPGSYLLVIKAVGIVVGGSFAFGNFASSGEDGNEPDDNFWQAQLRAVNEGVSGNLDAGIDRDFIKIDVTAAELINYRITGGDYHAQLFYANGQLAFTLPNNTIGRINIPVGTYYWGIKSPSGVAGPSVPYTFSAYRDVDNMTFNFGSDEGISGRVNWGSGNYFALKSTATVSGYAYDLHDDPVVGAVIRFTLPGSVGSSQTVATATTNTQGYYSTTISSPTGAGSSTFTGICNIYHYDVHTLNVQNDFGTVTESIDTITMIDEINEVNVLNSQIPLNDVAYYIHIGC